MRTVEEVDKEYSTLKEKRYVLVCTWRNACRARLMTPAPI